MKHFNLIITLSLLVLFFSCKKEADPPPTPYSDPSLAFLENAGSDSCSDSTFYIKGEFNGHKLCFATAGQAGSYYADTFSNAFFIYHYDSIKKDSVTDNLYLLRQNSSNTIMMALYCGQTHIEKRSFPYMQPHPNLERCEFTELCLMNVNHSQNIAQNSPQDNYSFVGYTGTGSTITFTNLTNDHVLEGEFNGPLRTNTGSLITLRNGKFRIKYVILNQTVD